MRGDVQTPYVHSTEYIGDLFIKVVYKSFFLTLVQEFFLNFGTKSMINIYALIERRVEKYIKL